MFGGNMSDQQKNPVGESPAKEAPITTSPVVKKIGTLNFFDALKEVLKNKRITRLGWKSREVYGSLVDTKVMLHKADGINYSWTINEGDLVARDWVVL